MGYELEKLKRTYGVSSAAEPRYAGTEKPDKPVSTATTAQVDAYNKQMAKYLADQQAFKDYKRDYNQRVNNASIYTQSQFQPYMPNQQLNSADFAVSNAPTYTDRVNIPTFGRLPTASGGLSAARAEGGIGESQYLQNIKNALKTGTPEEVQTQFNATPYDISRARSWIDPTKYADNKPTSSSLGTPGTPSFNPFNLTLSPEVLASIRKATGQNFAHGGPVKMQGGGFMDNQYIMTPRDEAPSNEMALQDMLAAYQGAMGPSSYEEEIKAAREKASAQQEELLKSLQTAAGSDSGSKAEMWFRLAAALGQPTRTGSVGETLGNVNQALAESSKAGRERQMAQRQLALEVQKIRAGAAKEDLETLQGLSSEEMKTKRDFIGKIIEGQMSLGKGKSEFAKLAMDLTGKPITDPEAQAKLAELVAQKEATSEIGRQATESRLRSVEEKMDLERRAQDLKEEEADRKRKEAEAKASKLSPTEIKAKDETTKTIRTINQQMKNLERAFDLNKIAYGGDVMDRLRKGVSSLVDTNDPKYIAAQERDNILLEVGGSAIKEIFGGAPSEFESKIATGLSGATKLGKEEKNQIMIRAIQRFAQKRKELEEQLKQINSGKWGEKNIPAEEESTNAE